MDIVNAELLSQSIRAMLMEAFTGPSGRGSWFTGDEPDTGMLSTLDKISAAAASRPLTKGDGATAAAHVRHLRYALHLANKAVKGQNPYRDADWTDSWAVTVVDEAAWKELKEGLRAEYEALAATVADPAVLSSEKRVLGMIGNVAHVAWHLGALRQGLCFLETPAPKDK